MALVRRGLAKTMVIFGIEHRGAQPCAKELLSRFLATDLTGREFLRQADKLSDRELRLLRELLIQQSIRKEMDDNIVNEPHSWRPWWLWRLP
jgi:hypothetical protein